MYLQYGTTVLKVIDLSRYERTNVYTDDGADLLYVKHTLGVSAVYAPGGVPNMPSVATLSKDTAAVLGGADSTISVVAKQPRGKKPGETTVVRPAPLMEDDFGGPTGDQFTGPETDAELRYRLLLPRQKLVLWAYRRSDGQPIRWLESPRPGFSLDAANGPLPLGLDVVAASGEPHSIAVHFTVSTCLPPCPIGSDRLVLAHRWQMTHGHDQNGYLTRTTQGAIVFHSGMSDFILPYPDAFRNQFLLPIPLGFERSVPSIVMSSDGLTMAYTLVDTDPSITFSPGDSNCTQIEITEQFDQMSPDPTLGAIALVGMALPFIGPAFARLRGRKL